jgi:hypothetical protein
MIRMGVNSDLPQNRRFPASSFEFRLFLYSSKFRFAHPPLAYMRARACIRVSESRKYKYKRYAPMLTRPFRLRVIPAHLR